MENEDLEGWNEAFANATGDTTGTDTTAGSNDTTTSATEESTTTETATQPATEVAETKPNESVATPSKPSNDVHRRNNENAQRRIRSKNLRLQERGIQRLQKEKETLESKGELTELDQLRIDRLNSELGALQDSYDIEREDADYEEVMDFNHQVAEELNGFADADECCNLIQKYAPYVNQYEPLVAELMGEKYGKHALAEWCYRVEHRPNALKSWQSMSNRAKAVALDGILKKIKEVHEGTNKMPSPQPKTIPNPSPKPINVGVAESGRAQTSNNVPASDDFGALIEAELQKMGRKNV